MADARLHIEKRKAAVSAAVLVAGWALAAFVFSGTTSAIVAWFSVLVVSGALVASIPGNGKGAVSDASQPVAKPAAIIRGVVGALLVSLFAVLIAECCDLGNAAHFLGSGGTLRAGPLAANMALALVFFCAAYLVTWKPSLSSAIVLIGTFALSMANATVFNMRGTPLDFSDLAVATTALSVTTGGMGLEIPAVTLVGLGLLMLALPACARVLPPAHEKPGRMCEKMRIPAAGARAATVVLAACVIFGATLSLASTPVLDVLGCPARPWYPANEVKANGFIATFWRSASEMLPEVPAGYSADAAEDIVSQGASNFEADKGGAAAASDAQAVQPTIIFVQNESLADLSLLPGGSYSGDALKFIHSLSGEAGTGQLTVSTFGGATILTEYEVLTGCSSAFVDGDYPYVNSVGSGMPSFVHALAEQGYACVANHPCNGADYGRAKVFSELGFDRFNTIDDYDTADPSIYCMDYISDAAVYDKTYEIFEQRDKSKPLFIFDITMQNHTGYSYVDAHGNLVRGDVSFEDGAFPHVDQYLARAQASDEAFEELISYFSKVDSPVVIVLYGDHLPELDAAFYAQVMGEGYGEADNGQAQSAQLADSQYLYKTPLVIWSNYGLATGSLPDMSANYLFPYVLDCAGLENDPFGEYLLDLHGRLPVVANAVFEDAYGTYHSYGEADATANGSADAEALHGYEIVQYGAISDSELQARLSGAPSTE